MCTDARPMHGPGLLSSGLYRRLRPARLAPGLGSAAGRGLCRHRAARGLVPRRGTLPPVGNRTLPRRLCRGIYHSPCVAPSRCAKASLRAAGMRSQAFAPATTQKPQMSVGRTLLRSILPAVHLADGMAQNVAPSRQWSVRRTVASGESPTVRGADLWRESAGARAHGGLRSTAERRIWSAGRASGSATAGQHGGGAARRAATPLRQSPAAPPWNSGRSAG
jgi:hypothetical protein